MSNLSKNTRSSIGRLAFSGVAIAFAFVLSTVRLFRMPTGGSVTLCSMFFITVVGSMFGPVQGLLTGFVYSILQFIQGPTFLSLPQFLFDYVLSFTALGLSGFFRKGKYSLQIGYFIAVFARFVFTTLASYFFWAEYLPELPGALNVPLIASMVYNGSYMGAEALITLVILMIPAVQKAIRHVARMAGGNEVK